ncbi:hypothetical protein TWF481_001405 [Arthrobotrys musiformis]|uniref:Uncharacterized protein n=1 Tax=Arthrobotrys musiformis TaxID=47236 RepID=A0AAV9WWI5_9PEZI
MSKSIALKVIAENKEEAERQKNGPVADFAIGFRKVVINLKLQPVHETLTLAALRAGGLTDIPPNMTYDAATPGLWEFFRGVTWNDDPGCALFTDSREYNNELSSGTTWFSQFEAAKHNESLRSKTGYLLGRSHFGDLQFLHSMSSYVGEPAVETRDKVLLWCELMYRIVTGEFPGHCPISLVDVSRGGFTLMQFFNWETDPTPEKNLKFLLTRDTEFQKMEIERRALGSLFHIIQDSYAKGHTKRVEDYSSGHLTLGAIRTFHCYTGQDEEEHSHHDSFKVENVLISDLDSFNPYHGARSAIEACIRVMELWRNGVHWYDYDGKPGAVHVLEDIFKLAPDVTSGDNSI